MNINYLYNIMDYKKILVLEHTNNFIIKLLKYFSTL